jgi:hypothetical protein
MFVQLSCWLACCLFFSAPVCQVVWASFYLLCSLIFVWFSSVPGNCRVFPLLVLLVLCYASYWLTCFCRSCWLWFCCLCSMQVASWGFLVSVLALWESVPLAFLFFGSLFPFLVYDSGCRLCSVVLVLAWWLALVASLGVYFRVFVPFVSRESVPCICICLYNWLAGFQRCFILIYKFLTFDKKKTSWQSSFQIPGLFFLNNLKIGSHVVVDWEIK